MKRLSKIALALAACALLNVFALAGVKSRRVEFTTDVKVGSTIVKRGAYEVKYDEQSGELAITSGGKVVAKSAAKLEERQSASKYASVYSTYRGGDGSTLLLSVNMGGKHAVIGEVAAMAR
ncbi:MAG TPA: hypothetical protein VEY09_14540 [Pyrinomonadaceae bacterium]|nr:hypothetical protein [Pyrinomonadaceae bacterium]